jgi:hypothetical protein
MTNFAVKPYFIGCIFSQASLDEVIHGSAPGRKPGPVLSAIRPATIPSTYSVEYLNSGIALS